MTRLKIPIQLRFLRIPTAWNIRTVEGRGNQRLFAFPKVQDDGSLRAFKVSELDGWQCREEFFELPEGDNDALLKFLAKMGVWLRSESELLDHWSKDVVQHCRDGHPMPVDVRGLWAFREALKQALVNKKAFKETYAPLLSRPETGLQFLQQSGVEFLMRLELTTVASGVVTITDAYHMLLASVFFDIARGIRFKICARKDCGIPFALESKHDKKFHTWYCGHITTVRKNRPHKGRKRAAKREARKKAGNCAENLSRH
jgi:hypothetical protein